MRKILLAVILPASLLAADVTMFRGDVTHSGNFPGTSTPDLSKVKWKVKTGGKVISSPAIVAGTAYVGSSDSQLYAIDISDGTVRWKFPTEGPVNSSPLVAGGLVYFNSVDGNFYAVDTATGKAAWKFQTEGERRFSAPGIHGITPKKEVMPDPFDVYLSSPAMLNGTIYFGSGDHNVYALDGETGTLKWKFTTGNVVHASPAVADGVLYIGSWDRNFYALDAASGKLLWKFETGDDTDTYNQVGIASSAAVADGRVYFGCRDSHFYALDAKTGKPKWAFDNKPGWVIASPAVHDGAVYFPTSVGKSFKALDAATGKVIFSYTNRDISFSSPAIVNGVAYYGTTDGWLHAIDIKTGKMLHEFETEGSKLNSPQYMDKDGKRDERKLYPDFTLDGIMVALNRTHSMGSVLSSPVIVDGVVYFGSTDGYLYALM